MASIGSPGVRCRSEKTPAVTRSRTGMVAPRRRRIRRATSPQPDVLEPHHPVGDRLVADDARTERLRLDRMDDVDHRQLVLDEPRHLAKELLALRLAARLSGLVEQRVELRI